MAINWALGVQRGPDAGERFANSFQQGMQQNKERTAQQAMAALAQDPNNERAYQALASVNPEAAMQFKQQRLEMAKQQMGEHYDSVLKGAQLIRQMQPKDDASWQQVLMTAHQAGIDVSQVPQHYDENYVKQVVGLADAFHPQPQDPGPIREFDEASHRGLLPQGTTYQQFLQMKNPGMMSPVNVPYGATVTGGGGGGQAPMTASDAHGNKVQYNPQSGQWEPIGGQTPPASGHFPSGPQ